MGTSPQSARADTAPEPEPLIAGFLEVLPFGMYDDAGNRTGFVVELTRMIGAELGLPITFKDYPNTQTFVAAQQSGEVHIFAGGAALPPFQGSNVFSIPIFEEPLRLATLRDQPPFVAEPSLSGLRVGIVPPALGASEQAFLARNTAVPFRTPEAAIMALLVGRVDALLLPGPVVSQINHIARLEDQIHFIEPPINVVTRHVVLHQSRAELMPPINAAILRIQQDGRLDALLRQFHITGPEPVPDVLTVGVYHFPPFKIVPEEGPPTGFAVEVLTDLAERANLQLEFQPVSFEDWQNGPTGSDFDILSLTSVNDERRSKMDITLPVLETDLSIFTRTGEGDGIIGLSDLQGRRVGAVTGQSPEAVATRSGLDLVVFDTERALLFALTEAEIDVALHATDNMHKLAERHDLASAIEDIDPPFFTVFAAHGLRFGLSEVRERLNTVIPGYLGSPRYAELRDKYFSPPVFWTETRIRLAISFASVGIFAALALSASNIWLAQRRHARALASVNDELQSMFNATSSGILAMNRGGQIVRINEKARGFLGETRQDPPFDWPEQVSFLDGETLRPLDNSANPIRRIASGVAIRGETHLLSRGLKDEDPRYIRVSNSAVPEQHLSIQSVVVLDDVSEEERNRQVVERKSRLDALGQLTGGIAHDFNNLLGALLYSLALAGRAEQPEKRAQHIARAQSSIERGRALTTRLLAFARKQPALATGQPVSQVFSEFSELVRPMLEANIELRFEQDSPDLAVYCDPAQLETALLNLTLNGRDAMLRAGKGHLITIGARAVDDPAGGKTRQFVEISVTDNGPGMDAETRRRAVDPFFTTKSSNSGTGLGLAMVYGFAQQAEGTLKIYSEPTLGTTVRLTLPRATDLTNAPTRPLPAEPTPGQQQTLLVVEDEPDLLSSLTELLLDLEYNVVSATSGVQAIDMVERGQDFDLLLTDIVMPGGVGGFELARRIRNIKPDVPIVYMSGYTGFSEQEMGDHVAPLLQKPANPTDLADVLQSLLFSNSKVETE